jgi:hypothetical protein
MLKIELVPNISNCIHAVTKKEYDDILRLLLSGKISNKKLRKKFELLTILLKEIDFKQLRRESERYLAEGKKVKFVFCLESGVLKYEMRVNN